VKNRSTGFAQTAPAVSAGDPRDRTPPFQAEPAGEGFFQVLGDDRGDGADVLVLAEGSSARHFPSVTVRATCAI
jgi:hypothetical protein